MILKGHKELEVWQKSMDLVTAVYSITKEFPKDEMYGLTSQIRRAAVSVPSNIAEGRARQSTKDYMRFVIIARGSIAELETQLTIAQNLSYATSEKLGPLLEETNRIGRMLNGLLSKLNMRLTNSGFFPTSDPQPPAPNPYA